MNSHSFFQNTECRYFPCHEGVDRRQFNCLFCYCPLYTLGDGCGGNFTYNEKGNKNCRACIRVHTPRAAEIIKDMYPRLSAMAGKRGAGQDAAAVIIFFFTVKGMETARLLAKGFEKEGMDTECFAPAALAERAGGRGQGIFGTPCENVAERVAADFCRGKTLIFIGAVGIAVRYIAPFVRDKFSDPAVVAADEKGENVIPVLSGHMGGANDMALRAAAILGGRPVITTATDINCLKAPDVYAKELGCIPGDPGQAKEGAVRLLAGEQVTYRISPFIMEDREGIWLIPKAVIVGVGCKKDVDGRALSDFVRNTLTAGNISPDAVMAVASIDIKKDEKALKDLCSDLNVPLYVYDAATLMEAEGDFEASGFVMDVTGCDNVCERAAWICAKRQYGAEHFEMSIKKTAGSGMTMSAAVIPVPEQLMDE